jgi:DNA-binding MarR family transcriptional regulator
MTRRRSTADESLDVLDVLEDVLDEATEALLVLSRTLVGVAASSLAATEDRITLVQYRALVMLGAKGASNVGSLAEELGIHPSTATRLCDRLILNGYIDRNTSRQSRREVTLKLSEAGRALVRAETARRRRAIRGIVARLDRERQAQLVDVLGALTDAADIGPEHAWRLGWTA